MIWGLSLLFGLVLGVIKRTQARNLEADHQAYVMEYKRQKLIEAMERRKAKAEKEEQKAAPANPVTQGFDLGGISLKELLDE